MWKKILLSLALLSTLVLPASQAADPVKNVCCRVREPDFSPDVTLALEFIFPNGTVTDNGSGSVSIATGGGAATMSIGGSITGGVPSGLLYVGAGPVLAQTSLSGLVVGNGASAPTAYAGVTCTNQVLRMLSATGAGTCTVVTSAYVDTSIWTGTVTSGILKASSQGVATQAVPGTDYVVPGGNTATATALAANGANCTSGQFAQGVDASGVAEGCTPLPTTISGTANEISASASTGPVTLSLPSALNLSSKVVRLPSGTTPPGGCSSSPPDIFIDTDATSGQRIYVCETPGTWVLQGGGAAGSAAFNTITSGTNTGATMIVGTGATLSASGLGTIAATSAATATTATTASSLVSNGSNCTGNLFALGVDASGNAECSQPAFSNLSGSITDAQVPNNITVDLATAATTATTATTATALAADGTDCSAGQYARGVDASGNATGCTSAAAGAGTVTSITASGGVETTSGSPITTTGTIRASTPVTYVSATSYTLLSADRGTLIIFTSASPVAVALPAIDATFPEGWSVELAVLGAGAVTLTPTAPSVIDSNTALTLAQGDGIKMVSDGANYGTIRGRTQFTEADTLPSVVARGRNVTTANSFANAITIGDTNNSTAIFADLNGPVVTCVVSGVQNDCNHEQQLNAGKTFSISDRNGDDIFTVTEAVGNGVITNAKLNAESTGNTITLPFKHNFKFVGCAGTTGTLLLDSNATLAPTATCTEGTTNTTLVFGYAVYPDSDGEYQVQDSFQLPGDFSSSDNIDVDIAWRTSATSGDVVFQVATMCTSDAEVEDVAWNTVSTVTDTAKGTTLQLNHAVITNLTKTNCVAGDYMHMKFMRQRTHASDTLAATVQVRNAEITIRRGM